MALDIEELPDLEDHQAGYQWIKRKGILVQNPRCESCDEPLELRSWERPYNERHISDYWICTHNQCEKKSWHIESLNGSLFQYAHKSLKLPYQIYLIKYFCEKRAFDEVELLLNITQGSVRKYYKVCQKFISDYLTKFPILLGANTKSVAVKLYLLSKPDLLMKKWLLVMVDTGKFPLTGYLNILSSTDFNEILLEVLQKIEIVVDPRSIIYSDEWGNPPIVPSNKFEIQNCSDSHMNDLCTYHYLCSETVTKIRNLNEESGKLFTYEFMWRERYQNDAFNTFINQMRVFYNQ